MAASMSSTCIRPSTGPKISVPASWPLAGTSARLVGVRQDNEGVLGSALALGTFAIGSGPTLDVFGLGGRAYKADRPHVGGVQQGINGLFGAVDQVDDFFRQVSLLKKLEDLLRRHWR